MIFKICGLREKDSLICCEANKVDFFGLVFYEKSPRNINHNKAKQLVEFSKNLSIKPVGVFVSPDGITKLFPIPSLELKHIQLHGDESQSYINEIKKTFKIKIIKKISIQNQNDLDKINDFENIDYILFDYKPKLDELPGGNSKSFNWNLLKDVTIRLPWFVSGGINESNIKNIQKTINPNGIDLSSGVERSLGIKSNKKINNLFKLFYDN